MQKHLFSTAEFAFIVATRAALGVGIGLLLSQKLSDEQRRAIGVALVAVGAVTTIPSAIAVYGSRQPAQLAAA